MPSYNVSGLMRAAPGTSRSYQVHEPALELDDDLRLAAPIEGEVRLSRTGRSILARADLATAIEARCSRCLRAIATPITVEIDEEALPSIDFESGQPVDTTAEPDALRLDEHHELHLDGPIREAISLAEPIAPLCRDDCPGLCSVCGADLNTTGDHQHEEDDIDPRLALLAEWRDGSGPH